MERCLVPNLAAADPLSLYHLEGLVFLQLALLGWHLVGVVVLGVVEVVSPGCGKGAHFGQQIIINSSRQSDRAMSAGKDPLAAYPDLTAYQQLTYLQFCTLPHLFYDYMNKLSVSDQHKSIADTFVLYTQTLLEFVVLPLQSQIGNTDISHFQANALSSQLLQFLVHIVKILPAEFHELMFSAHIHHGFYEIFLGGIKSYLNNDDALSGQMQVYFEALAGWFYMLKIEHWVLSGKKLIAVHEKNQRLVQYAHYLQHQMQPIRHKHSALYCKYQNLNTKLLFVLKNNQNPSTKNNIDNMQDKLTNPSTSLDSVHLNLFYPRCTSVEQKGTYLRKYYARLLQNGHLDAERLDQMQLMCLLHLQEIKEQPFSSKLEVYLYLISIKMLRSGQTGSLLEEVKFVLSLEKLPGMEASLHLVLSMMALPQPQQARQLKECVEFIILAYKKHSAQKSYIKLAIFCLLFIYEQARTISSSDRKQLLEKIHVHHAEIRMINNPKILDYLLELIWQGTELRPAFRQDWATNYGASELDIMEVLVQGPLRDIAQVQGAGMTDLVALVLRKRQDITQGYQHGEVLYNRLLGLLLQSEYLRRIDNTTVRFLMQSLQMYCLVSPYSTINEKLVRIFLRVLVAVLSSEPYFLLPEALVCLQLSSPKLNYQKLQQSLRSTPQKFTTFHPELFACINSYQLVQILGDANRGRHQESIAAWVASEENYLYTWPDTKRDRVLMIKRHRLIGYLANKLT